MVQKKGEGSNSNEIVEPILLSLRWCGNASTFPGAELITPGEMSSQGISWIWAPYGRREKELNKR